MLIPDINTFVKYIPTVGEYNPDPNRTEYDALLPFLKEAESMLQTELLGKDLFEYISSTTDEPVRTAACTVVACNAYWAAIPFVDLIQTPNGFAVVSNNNQAPASRERVDKLQRWLELRISEATDTLIILVFKDQDFNTEWKKFGLYDYYTECLFMTAASLRRYCTKDALRSNLDELHPVFMAYQNKISRTISHEYMNDIIAKRRNDSLTTQDIAMIRTLMTIMGTLYKNDTDAAYSLLESAVNVMVDNLSDYPEYANSQAYRIKTGNKYENKKNDPTFFF